jgi:hypothetical protein
VSPFFPHETVEWRLEEPPALRRLSLNLFAMAALAGVLLRLWRVAVLTLVGADRPLLFVLGVAVGVALVLGAATAHLGSYPVRHWVWRAPLFGLVLGAASLATSAALIALGIERSGTSLMGWSAWRGEIAWVLMRDTIAVSLFALLLGVVVQIVRRLLLRHERREHTLVAIHEEHVRHPEG